MNIFVGRELLQNRDFISFLESNWNNSQSIHIALISVYSVRSTKSTNGFKGD